MARFEDIAGRSRSAASEPKTAPWAPASSPGLRWRTSSRRRLRARTTQRLQRLHVLGDGCERERNSEGLRKLGSRRRVAGMAAVRRVEIAGGRETPDPSIASSLFDRIV